MLHSLYVWISSYFIFYRHHPLTHPSVLKTFFFL